MKHLFRALLVSLLASSAQAQARQSAWVPSIGGGVIEWAETALSTSMRNPGAATAIVMRGMRNVGSRSTGIEWGAAYASFEEPTRLDPTQTFAIDARVELHTPWEAVQPFAGIGPSVLMYGSNSSGRSWIEGGYNVGGGVRVNATPGLALIIDARIRGWDFGGSSEWTRQRAGELTLSLGFRR
jgi:hypothetical protein